MLVVSGDIDLHTTPSLRDQIRRLVDDGARHVVVDMAGVNVIDSTGLGALLGGRNQIYDLDGTMTLSGLREHVLKVFQITSLDQIFEIYPNREEAAAAAATGSPPHRSP